MDFISKLPQNILAAVKSLTTIGFKPEVIVRTAGGQKFVVLHHHKNACAIFFDLRSNEILVGADNVDFVPDLKYALSVSGSTSKELLATLTAAAAEYSLRKVGYFEDEVIDRMFESEEVEPSLFEKAGVLSNPNYMRACKQMQAIGLDVIAPFIVANDGNATKCYNAASSDPTSPMNKISESAWQHIVNVYKKISNYLATTANVGKNVAKSNEDNDVDNFPILSSPKKITLNPVDDEDAEFADMSDEELEKIYKEEIEDLSSYVEAAVDVVVKKKKNRLFLTRCCLVTGTSGTSKTFTVEAALEQNGLKKDVDYYITNLAANTAQALYNMLYENNGKIVVLDDAPNVFSGNNRIAFWKVAAETTPKPLGAPSVDTTKTNNVYYKPSSIRNRKDRFYKEAGWAPKTAEEELTSRSRGGHLKRVPAGIPNTFSFDGCVIVVANMPLSRIQKDVEKYGSADDWYAIRDRFKLITLAPPAKILWQIVKDKINADLANTALNDDIRIINSAFAADVIAEVESIMAEYPDRYVFQWRFIMKMGQLLAPGAGPMPADIDRIWKKQLRNMMLPKSSFR
jgi:hypothetical protein